MMKLTAQANADWTAYVLAQYPNEACAYVVDGELYPVTNHSTTPETTFSVDAIDRLKAHAKGDVQGFLHSHPYQLDQSPFAWDPAWATTADMVSWIADNIPWGIVATDGEGLSPVIWYDDSMDTIEPLEGREFVSGKNDCYSIVRDYYRQELGILIPNFARGMGWWDQGENLYENNFRKAGFTEVPLTEVTINDVLLMRVAYTVISHAAVVIGTNQILHHNMHRLSGTDTLARWSRQIEKVVRFTGIKSD